MMQPYWAVRACLLPCGPVGGTVLPGTAISNIPVANGTTQGLFWQYNGAVFLSGPECSNNVSNTNVL